MIVNADVDGYQTTGYQTPDNDCILLYPAFQNFFERDLNLNW